LSLAWFVAFGPVLIAAFFEIGSIGSVAFASSLLCAYVLAGASLVVRSDLGALGASLDRIAVGDLRQADPVAGGAASTELGLAVERMARMLSSLVARIRSTGALLAMDSTVLATQSRDLSARTEQQAAALEQTSASVEELTAAVRVNADASVQAARLARSVEETVREGSANMAGAMQSMDRIEKQAARVEEVVSVIDTLAFKTNILALNAAVEAANAGEAGRGFSVVASEVRHLAQQSAASAAEIRELVKSSSAQTVEGVREIQRMGEVFAKVSAEVSRLAGHVSQISAATTEQSEGLIQVSQAIGNVDQITQQNAHMAHVAFEASQALAERAQALTTAVARMRLRQGSADEARALVERAQNVARRQGVTAALVQIRESAAEFRDRDLYVFVFDRSGVYHAIGGDPKGTGRRLTDVPGIDAAALIADAFTRAEEGGGWVEYTAFNPANGKVLEKMSWVVLLATDLVIGCGIYKDAAA
jgi:methyl-accepting chemotaxis protein